jgi:formylmethanofuran--tetrahydromethanopterin N-formyltransferase
VKSELVEGVQCAYEIVIDGVDQPSVATAMRTAIEAAAGEGVLAIGAGNYGGKLGKYHIRLHELFA